MSLSRRLLFKLMGAAPVAAISGAETEKYFDTGIKPSYPRAQMPDSAEMAKIIANKEQQQALQRAARRKWLSSIAKGEFSDEQLRRIAKNRYGDKDLNLEALKSPSRVAKIFMYKRRSFELGKQMTIETAKKSLIAMMFGHKHDPYDYSDQLPHEVGESYGDSAQSNYQS